MNNELSHDGLIANKPQPIDTSGGEIRYFNHKSDMNDAMEVLRAGKYMLIEDFYGSGLELLNEVVLYLTDRYPNHTYLEQRAFRARYKKWSNLLLLRVKGQQLVVKKAPKIGWLEKLYPEMDDFMLTFPQIQGLNSAWQWYSNGVNIPTLRNKLHPYYGVYFPTRFEHLQVFDNWLSRYEGPKKSAIDVGIGSGVLSYLLVQHGFQKTFGTDTNPNAILGLHEAMQGTKLARKIEIDFGHLFGKWAKPSELIVFNPPWLPASHDLNRLDEAIYYNDRLFPEFFEEAKKRLLPEGRLLVLFSNLGQLTKAAKEHPVEQELLLGNRFELDKCYKKSVKAASEKTTRNQHWRAEEDVELWVLRHLGGGGMALT